MTDDNEKSQLISVNSTPMAPKDKVDVNQCNWSKERCEDLNECLDYIRQQRVQCVAMEVSMAVMLNSPLISAMRLADKARQQAFKVISTEDRSPNTHQPF